MELVIFAFNVYVTKVSNDKSPSTKERCVEITSVSPLLG